MTSSLILSFLADLEANNDIEWMHAHKPAYISARDAFLGLIDELVEGISTFDPAISALNAKDLVFRLNRDTRFSRDKAPYNPAFRAHISPAGRKPVPPGYYLQISPRRSFLGGGLFATGLPEATTMVRDFIAANPERWNNVVNSEPFASTFTIEGDRLKRAPRGYDPYHPLIDILKHKSWDIEYDLTEQDVTEAGTRHMIEIFRLMKPFNDLLDEATTGFTYQTNR